jgi:hypothetical protein
LSVGFANVGSNARQIEEAADFDLRAGGLLCVQVNGGQQQ